MIPRDYKKRSGAGRPPPGRSPGFGRGLLAGLSLSLVLTGVVHLYHSLQISEAPRDVVDGEEKRDETAADGSSEAAAVEQPKINSRELRDVLLYESEVKIPVPSEQFILQGGNFRTAEEAQAQRKRIHKLGYLATVYIEERDGEVWHRVRLGPYRERQVADDVRIRLKNHRIEVMLTRITQ